MVSNMANDIFVALAHPVRRGIVEKLARQPTTVGSATKHFGLSKPTISRHLKVLEEAGVVRRRVVGRQHHLDLNMEALAGPYEWLSRQREVWERMFDAVEDHLRARGVIDD
jgi:DNA-binding transcriptional ArsR family regulator